MRILTRPRALLLALLLLIVGVLAACGWASDPAECATSAKGGTNTRTEGPYPNTDSDETLAPAANKTLDGDLSATPSGPLETWFVQGDGTPAGSYLVTISGGGTHACMSSFSVYPANRTYQQNGLYVGQDNFNVIGSKIVPGDFQIGVLQHANQLGITNTEIRDKAFDDTGGPFACIAHDTGDNLTLTTDYLRCGYVGINGDWGNGTDQGIRLNDGSVDPGSLIVNHGPWFAVGTTKVAAINAWAFSTAATASEASTGDANGWYLPPSGLVAGHCDGITLYGPPGFTFSSATLNAWTAKCTNVHALYTGQHNDRVHAGTDYAQRLS